jgi:CDP-6-deoxy-D-xylo-4-hexulose-3-dehydrase
MIKLVYDTIDELDISDLISWLKTKPRLTKGEITEKMEKRWSEWLGVKHSLYVNSGSSANLAIITALKASGRFKNNKIVVPAVSWSTTVAPVMQLGLTPVLCDCDRNNLGLDLNHLKKICAEQNPAAAVIVHVLGIPCSMDEIQSICNENDVLLIEDSCESVGSRYKGKMTGTFGIASSFSFYFGHHISTIEGGMVCTNDDELCEILKSIRCHGWDRDLSEKYQAKLRNEYKIDEFRALYSFYWQGYNLRSTDLQAKIGLSQMKKIDDICKKRHENLLLYDKHIKNDFWKLPITQDSFVSNFAYPIITPQIDQLVNALYSNDIETRPLVCGSIGRQPFWKKEYGETNLPFANIVHDYGLYVPNNHQLTEGDIVKVCNLVNRYLGVKYE